MDCQTDVSTEIEKLENEKACLVKKAARIQMRIASINERCKMLRTVCVAEEGESLLGKKRSRMSSVKNELKEHDDDGIEHEKMPKRPSVTSECIKKEHTEDGDEVTNADEQYLNFVMETEVDVDKGTHDTAKEEKQEISLICK